jgi:PTS system cellobiose-specific IIB component
VFPHPAEKDLVAPDGPGEESWILQAKIDERNESMKILIVCGAGASSAFIAHRVRVAGRERGLNLTVVAGSEADLPASLDTVDVLLIGPHLAPRFDRISAQAKSAGAGVALLPDSVLAARDGELALGLAVDAERVRSWV